MNTKKVTIEWPNGKKSICNHGEDWLKVASQANINIPYGCLSGSCGACEIEINGEVIRACISTIPQYENIKVEFLVDPYWE